jgi:uncharacterized damage-inducible protein DinB
MSDQIPWVERPFNFDFPPGLYLELIERLRGTPARVEELARLLPPQILVKRYEDSWSIQENIGHLADLESLFFGRLEEFEAGADVLRPADMSNRVTHEAGHNERPIPEILGDLRSQRAQLVARLEAQPLERFAQSALHERLGAPMRLADMLYFHAEHDDHHIARAYWLWRKLAG